jgi:tetratricopeptide (TPR) repeat protein
VGIQESQGDWQAVVTAKESMIHKATDEQRVEYYQEIGTLYAEKLNDTDKAIHAYQDALDLTPEDHQILHKMVQIYSDAEQWQNAVDTIQRIADTEKESMRKGSFFQAAGTICRDKLKAHDEAIDYYNLALDCFFEKGSENIPKSFLPRALKAFADIDKILTTKRDWKTQERNYRTMIKRLKAGDPLLVKFWDPLAEIYRTRLKSFQSAVAAYEVAQELDPSNIKRREKLAELYLLAGDAFFLEESRRRRDSVL